MTLAPTLGSLLLESSRIITPEGTVSGGLVIRDGLIDSIIDELSPDAKSSFPGQYVDCGDNYILPGIIDGHVHVNEPGRTEWEGATTATRAAAAGGITTIVDMPLNSSPVTISVAALEAKRMSVAASVGSTSAFTVARSARPKELQTRHRPRKRFAN